jgi:hypothetical protein
MAGVHTTISDGEWNMKLLLGSLVLALSLSLAPAAPMAQQSSKAAPKVAGKGEKVCRTKLKYSGEVRTWVCKKDELCCVWHEINYTKCGMAGLNCL